MREKIFLHDYRNNIAEAYGRLLIKSSEITVSLSPEAKEHLKTAQEVTYKLLMEIDKSLNKPEII